MPGAFGPNPISRAAAPNPQLPSSQGYIGTGGDMFRPVPRFVVPGPPDGLQVAPAGWGVQFAPGQGGDTPGGGGSVAGETHGIATAWYTDGLVTPPTDIPNRPGQVGARPSRRSNA